MRTSQQLPKSALTVGCLCPDQSFLSHRYASSYAAYRRLSFRAGPSTMRVLKVALAIVPSYKYGEQLTAVASNTGGEELTTP